MGTQKESGIDPDKPIPSDTEKIYGMHSVESVLTHDPGRVIEVRYDRARSDHKMNQLKRLLVQHQVCQQSVDRHELNRLTGGKVHQGVIAFVRPRKRQGEPSLLRHLEGVPHPSLILILDQIQDPHNLGACLRVADGSGVDAVVLPKHGSCPVNHTVTRIAVGAVDRLAIFHVSNLSRTMTLLQQRGYWITGATDKATKTVYECDLTGNVVIALGSEAIGLRKQTMVQCDQLARIPMHGSVSSLNVSVAAGVFVFEAIRQRQFPRATVRCNIG